MVKNVSVVVLNRFRRTGTPHSLIFGGFRFRVTALRTDGRMDTPSYRDARTHLKKSVMKGSERHDTCCHFIISLP